MIGCAAGRLLGGGYREIKGRASMPTAEQVDRYRWDGHLLALPAPPADNRADRGLHQLRAPARFGSVLAQL